MYGEIIVTSHAVEKLRARDRDLAHLSNDRVRELIRREVQRGLGSGRVSQLKPHAFRLYRERTKGALSAPHQRFVWNVDATRGYVIDPCTPIASGTDGISVITTVLRTVA